MKKIYLKLLLVFMTFSLNAQVYTEVEEITLKEGTENDYEAFESFWGTVKEKMISDGASEVIESGPGKVLQGLFKKIDRRFPTSSASFDL